MPCQPTTEAMALLLNCIAEVISPGEVKKEMHPNFNFPVATMDNLKGHASKNLSQTQQGAVMVNLCIVIAMLKKDIHSPMDEIMVLSLEGILVEMALHYKKQFDFTPTSSSVEFVIGGVGGGIES